MVVFVCLGLNRCVLWVIVRWLCSFRFLLCIRGCCVLWVGMVKYVWCCSVCVMNSIVVCGC